MNLYYKIPEPLLFNPLKHHLGFIKEYIEDKINNSSESDKNRFLKEIKHLGTSVMDIYTGSLSIDNISTEALEFLRKEYLEAKAPFAIWAGKEVNDFRINTLSDGTEWTFKFYDNEKRYVHIFPARSSPHTFRVKANTLKSAILYNVLIGKDFITADDLNRARASLSLSPVKDAADAEAITEMIEILRR